MYVESKLFTVHTFFNLSVIIKGIDGALEIIGGALLFFIPPQHIDSVVRALTQHELSEDPKDMLATYLLNNAHNLTKGVTIFAAVYLLWHGLVKAGLVAGLLLKRRWAYPAAIIAFVLFILYQLYRYTHTHSPSLLALTVLDLFVIILTWIEYKRLIAINGFSTRRH